MSFTIDRSMNAKQINQLIDDADRKLTGKSLVKDQILETCFNYSRNNLAKAFIKKDKSRYDVVSDLLNFSPYLDDLHYSYFAAKQVSTIPSYENSTLRNSILPDALATLDTLLAPSIARMQKAFIGLLIFGLMMIFTGYFYGPQAYILMAIGIIGIFASGEITYYRTKRSLSLKLNLILTGGSNSDTINDGLCDEFSMFEKTASNMLTQSLKTFQRIFSFGGN